MIIKVAYRKNLKLTEGKLASQVAHAVKNLGLTPIDCNIIVLKYSDKKFFEIVKDIVFYKKYYIQKDKGLTQVQPNTITCCAWISY